MESDNLEVNISKVKMFLKREQNLGKVSRYMDFKDDSKIVFYRFVGILTYVNIHEHIFQIYKRSQRSDLVVLSFRFVTLADHDALLALQTYVREQEQHYGVNFILAGVKSSTVLYKKIQVFMDLHDFFMKRSYQSVLCSLKNVEKNQLF
jgi:MFS superfamily sulfate permease-like transporter